VKPIERLEQAAEEKYGKASAVSINRAGDEWVARVWDAKGGEVAVNRSTDKVGAIMGLVRRLNQEESS
jgi:hypothetical protein